MLNNRKPADDAEAKKEAYDGTADSVKDKDNHKDDQPSAGAASAKSDLMLMANDKMQNAVDYLLNQWKSLENFIKSGMVEISNNLCEQRMKTVKLNLKNCQNIGSEDAAENAAFMFSVTESCWLNDINPVNYLEMIFTKIRDGEAVTQVLLPCYYKEKC